MFYFINEYLLAQNSSVEHAAINRVKLFRQAHQPAKIVTKTYDCLLHRNLATFGLVADDVVNLFDYFQAATRVAPRVVHTVDLPLSPELEIRVGANFSRLTNGDVPVGLVRFVPGTVGRVAAQEFWDPQGNLTAKDLWDWRGFRSATQFFGQNGQLMAQTYYTPQGAPVIEEYFAANPQGQPVTTRLILVDYQRQGDRYFADRDELFTFFLAELSREEPATFISDRPATGIPALLALGNVVKKVLYLPINHVTLPGDPRHAALDGYLRPAFAHLERFAGLVTNTAQQAADILARYPQARVVAIPPVALPALPVVPMGRRRPHSLLYVGRLAADKRLKQLLRIVALVHQRIDDVTLTLYGYGNPAYVHQLKTLVADLQLTSVVTFAGYTADLAERYDDYQVMVTVAASDGGPLGMYEALSHGLPVVSTRFDYGPAALIRPGVNGDLVAAGDEPGAANTLVALLSDPSRLTRMSLAAYASARAWTPEKVWRQWQAWLTKEG